MKQTRVGRQANRISGLPAVQEAGPSLREQTQAAEESGFAAVFETSGEALAVLSATGVLQRANRRARELLCLAGRDGRKAKIESYFENSSPVAHFVETSAARMQGETAGCEAVLKSGAPLRVTLRTILPETGDLLLCLEGRATAERTERDWRQSQAEIESLLQSVDAGILLLDRSGGVRGANARFAELFSLDRRQVAAFVRFEQVEEALQGRLANPQAFSGPWRAFQRDAAAEVHQEIEVLPPSRRILKRYARPVAGPGGWPAGWLEIFTDVTGEKQIPSKWIQTEKMAALGQLVSGIAHELNNPLTGIMGYAQLLLGQDLPPVQRGEAAKVCEEAERARHIVKNLLYFARESKPEHTRVNLNEIVERTLALRSYELKVENIAVERDLAPDLAETMADSLQLQQVALNLIVNAEQALLESRGQGRIALRTRHVPPNRIALDVSDDGPGIPPEILHRVFDPFFTTKPPGSGTGLGLSIAYGIVRQHDGEVTVENLPGGGARFTVELPVLPVPAAASMPSAAHPTNFRERTSPVRVLVVEDEPTVAQLIVDVLQEEGYAVEAVLDSQEGLTRLSRRDFDLVICDLRMPRLDGPAFYEALVHSGSPLQHSILFVTGDTLAPRTQEFLEGRRLAYLAKPFLVEELKLAVNRIWEANGGAGSHPQDIRSEAMSS